MTKHVQNFSAKINEFLAQTNDDVFFVVVTAVFVVFAQSIGLLP